VFKSYIISTMKYQAIECDYFGRLNAYYDRIFQLKGSASRIDFLFIFGRDALRVIARS
jgi:hypothetical protein